MFHKILFVNISKIIDLLYNFIWFTIFSHIHFHFFIFLCLNIQLWKNRDKTLKSDKNYTDNCLTRFNRYATNFTLIIWENLMQVFNFIHGLCVCVWLLCVYSLWCMKDICCKIIPTVSYVHSYIWFTGKYGGEYDYFKNQNFINGFFSFKWIFC